MSRTYSTADSPNMASHIDRRSISCSATIRNPMRTAPVQRWAGLTRTVSEWDGLRRDPELWFEDGDCLIHLYALGQSRRGPSFCVPFKTLKNRKCGSMFSLCFAQITSVRGDDTGNSGRLSSVLRTPVPATNKVELYVPAPDDTSREESFRWHITTRNFFAFIFGKPLVGAHLGQSLIDLQERMHLFRSGRVNNHEDLLDYADDQGYRDFVDCPDYALAMLYYAENYRMRDVWIDAFAHCVGMNESLALSQEFAPQSRVTKALITRAYLEMDIQLSRATRAVRNFLEDDLSPAYLGLSEGLRNHLDRFRSFLHGFYVDKFGYWPPPKGTSFSKAMNRSLYYDFKNMYDYLVDSESTPDLSLQRLASGGICVLQNVESFDRRLKFPSLPHPLPLLPSEPDSRRRTESQKALRALTLGSKQAKTERYLSARASLIAATNSKDIAVTTSRIIQEYMRFERHCASTSWDEKVSRADARKVRWLLIYGTLQYLISALRAPAEVRDTESVDYPLCCLVTESSPWDVGVKSPNSNRLSSVSGAINNYLMESADMDSENVSAIEPDGQKYDYLDHTNTDFRNRPISVEMPAPLKVSRPSRSSSIRSLRHLSLPFVSRSNSLAKPKLRCEIPPSDVMDSTQMAFESPSRTTSQPSSQIVSRRQSVSAANTQRSSRSTLPEGAGPETSWLRPMTPVSAAHSLRQRPSKLELDHPQAAGDPSRTPTVDSFQMEEFIAPISTEEDTPKKPSSSSGSASSDEHPFWSDGASSASSHSSAHDEHDAEPKMSPAEESGLLGGLVSIDGPLIVGSRGRSRSQQPTPTAHTPIRSDEFQFSFDTPSPVYSHEQEEDDASEETTIGVAISPPPSRLENYPSTRLAASMSVDNLSLTQRIISRKNSFTTRLTSAPKYTRDLSPLRMNPPSPMSDKLQCVQVDMLTMMPVSRLERDEWPSGRRGSESTRSILDAIPPPIPRRPSNVKKGGKYAVEEEERGRKKERRKSFWRR